MKKGDFNPTAYKNKFNAENYDRLHVSVPKGQREVIREHAKKQGKSLNSYICDLIERDMQKDR